jgi:hypothetical protein
MKFIHGQVDNVSWYTSQAASRIDHDLPLMDKMTRMSAYWTLDHCSKSIVGLVTEFGGYMTKRVVRTLIKAHMNAENTKKKILGPDVEGQRSEPRPSTVGSKT